MHKVSCCLSRNALFVGNLWINFIMLVSHLRLNEFYYPKSIANMRETLCVVPVKYFLKPNFTFDSSNITTNDMSPQIQYAKGSHNFIFDWEIFFLYRDSGSQIWLHFEITWKIYKYWYLDPTPRDTDLFDLGCGLGIVIFKKRLKETFLEEPQFMDFLTQPKNEIQERRKSSRFLCNSRYFKLFSYLWYFTVYFILGFLFLEGSSFMYLRSKLNSAQMKRLSRWQVG